MKLFPYLLLAAFVFLLGCKPPREKALNKIKEAEIKMSEDSSMRINAIIANELISGYLTFAEQFPKDSLTPDFLFKAGEVNNGLGKPNEAINLYKKVYYEYPSYKRAEYCLFLMGFTYETHLSDYTSAANIYQQFIEKHPGHSMADDVKFSLENLGKSDEELIKQFLGKQDSTTQINQGKKSL